MTYIMNMANGSPYPDDELVHPRKSVAKHPHSEPLPGTEHTQLQLVTPHPTQMDQNSAALAAGLDITALIQALED